MAGNSIDLGTISATIMLSMQVLQAQVDSAKAALSSLAEATQAATEPFTGLDEAGVIASAAIERVSASAAQSARAAEDAALVWSGLANGYVTLDEALGSTTASMGALGESTDATMAPADALSASLLAIQDAAVAGSGALVALGAAAVDAGASLDAGAASADANSAALDANAEAADAAAASQAAAGGASSGLGESFKKLVAPAAIAEAAVLGLGAVAVHLAGTFQEQMTQLVTGAGESQKNLKLVSDGILAISQTTGESTSQLAQGMFTIESAGDHGAKGLAILRDATEAAKESGAQMADTANALTTVIANYGNQGVSAANATNFLLGIVSNGKTTMQALASSISTVLPAAAKYGVSLNDVGGALATMTAQNGDAAASTTYLRQLLTSLASPSAASTKALASIGLSAQQVSDDMKKSLPDTLQLITDRINSTFPPGSVAANTAFKDIAGGARQMQGMLLLTGNSMGTFKQNVQNVSDAVKQGGNNIAGWSLTQKDLNTQLAQAVATAQVALIQVGTALEPIVKQIIANLMPALKQFGDWAKTHGPEIARAFAIAAAVIGVVLVAAVSAATVNFLILNAAAIGIVGALGLVAAGVALVVTHWQQIVDFFHSTSPAALAVKTALVALGGALAGAAVYGITVFVASLPALIAGFVTWASVAGAAALATLAAAAPFIAIGAAVALVAFGIYELITHWSQVKTFLGNIASAVGAFFQTVASFVTTWGEKLLNLYLWPYREAWTLLQAAWHAIVGLVQQGVADVVGSFSWLYNHNYYFKDLVDFITSTIQNGLKFVEQLWTNDVHFVLAIWDDLKRGAQIEWEDIQHFIIHPIQAAWTWLTTTIGGWASWLGGQWRKIVSGVTSWWDQLTGAVKSGGSAAFDQVKAIFITPLTNAISGIITNALTWGENLMKMLAQGIANGAGAIKNAATRALGGLAKILGFHSPAAEGPGADADTWAPNLMKMFAQGLAASGPLLAQAAASALLGVHAALTSGATSATLSGGTLATPASVNPAASGVLREAIAGMSGLGSSNAGASLLGASSPAGAIPSGGGDTYHITVEVAASPSDGEPYQAGIAFGNGFAAGFQQARTQRGL